MVVASKQICFDRPSRRAGVLRGIVRFRDGVRQRLPACAGMIQPEAQFCEGSVPSPPADTRVETAGIQWVLISCRRNE